MRINIGFSNFSDDDLADEGDKIFAALTGNAHFPSPMPTLSTVSAAILALRNAIALPAGPARATAIAAARTPLENLLQQLGQNLATTPGVTAAMLATSGYTLPKKSTRTTQPPIVPPNVRLANRPTSGTVIGRCDPSPGASSYQTQWTYHPINGLWTMVPAFESSRGMKLTGLTRGKDYYVVTGRNRGPWSEVASGLAM